MTIKSVIKTDGSVVPFDADKFNRKNRWAADRKVNWSDVAFKALRRLSDGCSTSDIDKAIIDACVEEFDEKHFLLAGRVLAGVIYKEAFGSFKDIPTLKQHHDKMVELGYWEKLLYSEEEFSELEKVLDHSKDLQMSYPQIKQISDKYILRNRVKDVALESPQFMYMGMAMANMKDMPKERRLEDVIKYYTYLSDFKICAPTPFMTNLRTPSRSYASCCVYTTHDTASSLAAGDHIAYMMTCASAGIGSHVKTRSKGDPVRGGTTVHQGKRPYYKMVESAVSANLQNCYSDDTEVLTSKGFKLFKDLTENDLVGQVHDTGGISFIEPLERQVYDYKGVMYSFSPDRNTCMDLLVTPNHRMVWKKGTHVATEENREYWTQKGYVPSAQKNYLNAPVFSETLAEDFEPKRHHVMFFGGNLQGTVRDLSPLDRLKIAFQADGARKHTGDFAYSFHFSKERKVERMRWILGQLPFDYTESVYSDGTKGFYIKVGFELKKDFSDLNLEDKHAYWCKEFLREMNHWDGTTSNDTSKDVVRFFCTEDAPVKFVEAVAAGCGAYCNTTTKAPSKNNHTPLKCCYISFDKKETTGRAINKTLMENYNGKVYCVTVPTGKIVVRRNGFSVVCGNSRGGSATMYFNCLDPEVMEILKWKSKKTASKIRVDGIHYNFGSNSLFAKKVYNNEDWMLISYGDAPDLHEAMYDGDQEKFDELYHYYLHSDKPKQLINARKVIIEALVQGQESGQVYLHRPDEMNRHTPFKSKIYQSNLCCETAFPSVGFDSVEQLYEEFPINKDGSIPEIGLCSLSAVVARRVKTLEEWMDVCYYAALSIDNVLEIMDYPFPALEYTAKARRNIGVGITDLAGLMAEEKLKYSSIEGKRFIHRIAEQHAYSMIKASNRLAMERGECEWVGKTKWKDGWLPIDTMNQNIQNKIKQPLMLDWESLREEVMKHGVRFSVTTNFMPNESSSIATNGTNSILPARNTKLVKTNGSKKTRFLVPNYDSLADQYELAYDIPAEDLFDVYAIVQCFTDQSISADEYLDFTKGKITGSDLLRRWMYMQLMGLKTRYYVNSKTNSGSSAKKGQEPEHVVDTGCASGGCSL